MSYGNQPNSLYESQMNTGEQLAESKWSQYCHSLKKGPTRNFTACLLENTDKYLSSMDETTRALQVGNFDKYAFPMVRAIFPNLIANEIVSVQPMSGPVSQIFYLDYLFAQSKGQIQAGTSAFDPIAGPTDTRTYSSDEVDGEQFATGDGTVGPYSATLSRLPIRQGSVSVDFGGGVTAFDNGSGVLAGPGIAAGSVDYDSGFVTVTTTGVVAPGTSILSSYRYDDEANEDIAQLDLQLTTSPVQAKTRKLRARWSMEAAQNLNSLHGLDAEAELVGAIAEEIKFEIDREIINDLFSMALAGVFNWSSTVPPGVSFTEHKLSFIDSLIEGSNLIFSATRRGMANFLVCSVAVSNVIESQPTFVAEPGALETQGTTGVVKIGTLNNRWTVYKDPFLGQGLPNSKVMILGYKGNNFLEAGYVYAPYIPLYATPTVMLDDFVGRKGMATQYGKRAVNARFYANGFIIP